jgi:uncharacterized protein (UPF0332 family)
MSLTNEERTYIVQMELEKADRFLGQAKSVAESQMWDLVANRIYYSVYHAVLALFIHDKIEARTHKGAVVVFGQRYVSTGIFDKKWGKLYAKLQDLREKCDYNLVYATTEEEMKPLMDEAELLIAEIKSHIL